MTTKKVSMVMSSECYAVLRSQAALDERSVRSWFDRYIKATFPTEYRAALNKTPPQPHAEVTPTGKPNTHYTPSLHPEWDED